MTHNPDLEMVHSLLASLAAQVVHIVIVDNGSSVDLAFHLQRHRNATLIELLALPENVGIAAAQNLGIERLKQRQIENVILFDHDSIPAPDMVRRLIDAADAKRALGVNVAAVGPRYLDSRQDNPPPFIRRQGFRVKRQTCASPDSVVEVSYLVASGCLIPTAVLDIVGGMQEDFFIDYVDIEWGLRAQMKGFKSFGVCGASMSHRLGEAPIRFLGRCIPLHAPLRHYYHFRNAIWLYRQGHLPFAWKVADGMRLLLKYGFYTLIASPRHLHWWMMTKGAWHGLIDRMGRHR